MNFEALEEDEEVRALKTELGKARLAKEKFKLVAIDVRKEVSGYEKKMQLPQEPLNKKPRGLAETNSVELCGAAIVSSSFEGKRETDHEHIAWF